jgi:hypothetical protein
VRRGQIYHLVTGFSVTCEASHPMSAGKDVSISVHPPFSLKRTNQRKRASKKCTLQGQWMVPIRAQPLHFFWGFLLLSPKRKILRHNNGKKNYAKNPLKKSTHKEHCTIY